jgi:hypothetical protein
MRRRRTPYHGAAVPGITRARMTTDGLQHNSLTARSSRTGVVGRGPSGFDLSSVAPAKQAALAKLARLRRGGPAPPNRRAWACPERQSKGTRALQSCGVQAVSGYLVHDLRQPSRRRFAEYGSSGLLLIRIVNRGTARSVKSCGSDAALPPPGLRCPSPAARRTQHRSPAALPQRRRALQEEEGANS